MNQEQGPKSNHEQQKQLESIRGDLEKMAQNRPEKELTKAEKEHGNAGQVEQLRYSAEKQSQPIEKTPVAARESEPKAHPVTVNKELKNIAYQRALVRARKRLSAPSRAFSKVVHNKAIESASEVVGNSVARPSGMLGGAFFALVGTSLLLWITRRYGYEYNYLMVIILFVVGMAIGLGIEGIYRTKKRFK